MLASPPPLANSSHAAPILPCSLHHSCPLAPLSLLSLLSPFPLSTSTPSLPSSLLLDCTPSLALPTSRRNSSSQLTRSPTPPSPVHMPSGYPPTISATSLRPLPNGVSPLTVVSLPLPCRTQPLVSDILLLLSSSSSALPQHLPPTPSPSLPPPPLSAPSACMVSPLFPPHTSVSIPLLPPPRTSAVTRRGASPLPSPPPPIPYCPPLL